MEAYLSRVKKKRKSPAGRRRSIGEIDQIIEGWIESKLRESADESVTENEIRQRLWSADPEPNGGSKITPIVPPDLRVTESELVRWFKWSNDLHEADRDSLKTEVCEVHPDHRR